MNGFKVETELHIFYNVFWKIIEKKKMKTKCRKKLKRKTQCENVKREKLRGYFVYCTLCTYIEST